MPGGQREIGLADRLPMEGCSLRAAIRPLLALYGGLAEWPWLDWIRLFGFCFSDGWEEPPRPMSCRGRSSVWRLIPRQSQGTAVLYSGCSVPPFPLDPGAFLGVFLLPRGP